MRVRCGVGAGRSTARAVAPGESRVHAATQLCVCRSSDYRNATDYNSIQPRFTEIDPLHVCAVVVPREHVQELCVTTCPVHKGVGRGCITTSSKPATAQLPPPIKSVSPARRSCQQALRTCHALGCPASCSERNGLWAAPRDVSGHGHTVPCATAERHAI